MATLRNTAIGLLRLSGWDNIAAGLRHRARAQDHPIKLLLITAQTRIRPGFVV